MDLTIKDEARNMLRPFLILTAKINNDRFVPKRRGSDGVEYFYSF